MPLDPVALAAAVTFTAGCAGIHVLRRHADILTCVLGLLAFGLATAVGSLLVGRASLLGSSEPIPAWALVASTGI